MTACDQLSDRVFPLSQNREISPPRVFILLVVQIFFAELVAMYLISHLAIANLFQEAVIDGLIMIVLIFPGLYYFQFHPLLRQIQERKRAERLLENQNQELRLLGIAEHRQRELAESLVQATISVNTSLNLDQVLNTILGQIRKAVAFECAEIVIVQDETLQIAGCYGCEDHPQCVLSCIKNPPASDYPLVQQVITTLQPVNLINVKEHPLWRATAHSDWVDSYVAIPLLVSGQVTGVINLYRDSLGAFEEDEIDRLLAFAAPAALAMHNARLFEEVRLNRDRAQSLAHKLVEVQEWERQHIARELHDEAGQSLSFLKINLGRLEADTECPPHVSNRLGQLKGLVDRVLDDLHRLAMDLRPAVLNHLGLIHALEQLASLMSSDSLVVRFKALGFAGGRLPSQLETSLYRIVQEALTNVVRHAQAKNVGVLLERSEGKIKLFIEDDGIGLGSDLVFPGNHLGILGIRERAEMFGGSLSIESSPGKGTAIIVEVPDGNPDSDR